MSWWGSSPIEGEVLQATASSIPSGDQDLALNLEICDSVRSKQATPKDTLRALKKRLYDTNPNVQILTLHLLDLLVKNGGAHFFVEFAAKEFVDAYVAELLSLHNQRRNLEVIGLMLEYFQTWARASSSKAEAKYLQEKYTELKRRKDIEFPETISESEISSSFLESATAPEWTDSDTCMKSGQAFSFYNRKHHCRNCGGVFLQEYCANFIPLPHFGINVPVRVCDDCHAQIVRKSRSLRNADEPGTKSSQNASYVRGIASNNRDMGSKFHQDLEEAINLSLKTTPEAPKPAPPSSSRVNNDEDMMDEDVRRAIEASLSEIGPQSESRPLYDRESQTPGAGGVSMPQAPAPTIPPKDREAIESYISLVQDADPREAIYNTQLTDLNRRAIELQPKIISELKLSTHKLGTLEDLNGKLLAVASYYDRLLEAELNPGQYIPPATPHPHTYQQPPGDTFDTYEPSPVYPSKPAGRESEHIVQGKGRDNVEQPESNVSAQPEPVRGGDQQGPGNSSFTTDLPQNEHFEDRVGKSPGELVSESSSRPESRPERDHEAESAPGPEPESEPEPEPEPEPVLIEL